MLIPFYIFRYEKELSQIATALKKFIDADAAAIL